jgi:lipopolysaccharide heptosyltransferase I
VSASLKVLIVKLSAVGDVVHTLPALDALRREHPRATIGWVAHPGPAALLEGHPQLDFLFKLSRPRSAGQALAAMRELREVLRRTGPWDVAIDFQGLTKSGIVAWLSGAPKRIGFAGQACRELNWLFTNERVAPTAQEVINMNLELVRSLGCRAEHPRALLVTHAQDEEYVATWAREAGVGKKRFFLLDAFAGWVTKRWPLERWAKVAVEVYARHALESMVFFGPGEEQEASHLANLIAKHGGKARTAPPTSLRQYVALLRHHVALFAGGDTGPMHMAAALGVPTVALFGSSDSRRNAPVFADANFEVLQDFSQPCAGTFWRKCPHHPPGHCLDKLAPEAVLDAIERVMKRAMPIAKDSSSPE